MVSQSGLNDGVGTCSKYLTACIPDDPPVDLTIPGEPDDSRPHLFGCAEPRRREGRDGLGAGGWDAQLLYGLEGDMCAHAFKGKHKV